MTLKVYISKNAIDGIRRVVEAQIKHLPSFGVQVVHELRDADIILNHGAEQANRPGIPIVNCNHGLYWSRQPWGSGYREINRQVVDAMVMAVAHTAPSEWVSNAIRRGGYWYPEVVYHGIDADEWPVSSPSQVGNYVLWNKARADYVSDPRDMNIVANLLPDVKFKTTLGQKSPNVEVVGALTFEKMKRVVGQAAVYLATARETFGIGTLEALASGVPVAGWDWGGQHEIIIQGQTGYLAPPGDFKALAECIKKCFEDRARLSANARQDVRDRWRWEPRIEQYANLLKRVHAEWVAPKPKVAVVVTAYNLDKYLPACLRSVEEQTFGDFECLIVDDAQSEATALIAKQFTEKDNRFRYTPTPQNMGLAAARNYSLTLTKAPLIRHLDADDLLELNALELEVTFMDQNPGVHIAYGHLGSIQENGEHFRHKNGEIQRSGWPPDEYDWFAQMSHLNQLPSCSMVRREVYERSGGYRARDHRNEDAYFWCRTTSLGFRAKKFTQAVTYWHRHRENSKGAEEWRVAGSEPDWTAWFPWRMGAEDYGNGAAILQKYGHRHPNPAIVPFGAQGVPEGMMGWHVHDYAYPVVSVIVTVGPGHEKYLIDALDSLQAQTFPDWECIVVNDTGKDWPKDIMGAPWAKVINMEGNRGAAAARNEGYKHARGHLIAYLDGDDYWMPWFLERTVAYWEVHGGIIYTDSLHLTAEGLKKYPYPEFECDAVKRGMRYAGSSVLIPREVMDRVNDLQGGWDEQIPGMEDWDFQLAMHHLGFCAYRVAEPLFVYRLYSSTKREVDHAKIDAITNYVNDKWRIYRLEGRTLGCGCATKRVVANKPQSLMSSSGDFDAMQAAAGGETIVSPEAVTVEYRGSAAESFRLRSRVSPGVMYKFGNNPYDKRRTVLSGDLEFILSLPGEDGKPAYVVVEDNASEVVDRTIEGFLAQPVQG